MYYRLPNPFTLLHLASFFGILPLAENIIRKKGWINRRLKHYVNKKDGYGNTALAWAARRGHEAIVLLLLEKGADIEAKGYFGTALVEAASGGYEAIVLLLLEKGADIEAKGYFGTALVEAARKGHEAMVQLLLEKGANA
jgi:ankyrin repeat protein